MEKMNHEQELSCREADLAAREMALLRRVAENSNQNRPQNKCMSVREIADALPEFNPNGGASPNVRVYVRRVKILTERYEWDADLILLVVKQKFKGAANIWANSLEDELLILEDFFELIDQFSANVSGMELHVNDEISISEEMYVLGRNGGLREARIVQYILKGLRDTYLRQVAMASCPVDVSSLLTTIRFCKSIENPNPTKEVKTQIGTKMQRPQAPITAPRKTLMTRRTECCNCWETGHIA
jgi:hypothetical protein